MTSTLTPALISSLCLLVQHTAVAQNQTSTLSPVMVGGNLPYSVQLELEDYGATAFPTLHSFASATYDGKWVLLAGRTNGLHSLTAGGFTAFPPASQNRDVWVIDPVSKQTWRRSLESADSGLTTTQIDSITTTNNQFYQSGNRLYTTGGYGFDRTNGTFGTYSGLTAFDLPSLVHWVQDGTGQAADSIRQIQDPIFKVTGGEMEFVGGRTHIVFGQDFDGPYLGGAVDGHYTKQIRSFDIVDDGVNLSVENIRQTMPEPAYRRRDLNVVPVLRQNGMTGMVEESLLALSGVFTPPPGFGIWTVPVEIDANGNPSMADPNAPDTFKQGMNIYHSAKLGMYSSANDAMHNILFGGLSYQFYDRQNGIFVEDPLIPFINQITSIVIDHEGRYTQTLLDEEFPELFNLDNGQRWHFGTNAELILREGVPTLAHDIVDLDAITQPTVIGYIVGGIAADQGNFGNTVASNLVFRVTITPIPEPGCGWLATLVFAWGFRKATSATHTLAF